jgi:electron transfer flavoprotein alpha subunit
LQGIKDCRHVIAVNLDGSAPIVKRANLTIIGDTAATIVALNEAVTDARLASRSSARATSATPATSVVEGVAA